MGLSVSGWISGVCTLGLTRQAPIGLQLIGYQSHDEETLAALRAVLAALGA